MTTLHDNAATNSRRYAEGSVGGYEINLFYGGFKHEWRQDDVTQFCVAGEDRVPRKVIALLQLLL